MPLHMGMGRALARHTYIILIVDRALSTHSGIYSV